VASARPQEGVESHGAQTPGSPERGGDLSEERSAPSEITDASFPVSVRGYDRAAVDAYVNRVKQFLAQLEVTRSPEGAVKQALERVAEQTRGLLARAGETVEEITVAARQEAEQRTAQAKSEAEDIVAKAKAKASELVARASSEAEATVTRARNEAAHHLQRARDEAATLRRDAEARVRELQADAEAIREERSRLLDNIRQIGTRVGEVASAADARFQRPHGEEQREEGREEPAAASAAEASEVTATEATADADRGPSRAEDSETQPGHLGQSSPRASS
jgi:DivIVA domain-containing protein